jgi:hypothetical protein
MGNMPHLPGGGLTALLRRWGLYNMGEILFNVGGIGIWEEIGEI